MNGWGRRNKFPALKVSLLLLAFAFPLSCGTVDAQTSVQKPQTDTAPPAKNSNEKRALSVRVINENVLAISLESEGAKLKDIAAELSQKLKIPVILSRVMEKQTIDLKYSEVLLEPAMQMLAPVVFIDYQIDSAPGARPRPLGIFLFAHNEPPPAADAVVKGKSQAFVITGNTEANGDETDDSDPIQISYRNGHLTANAKDQPLVDVISDIAEEAGIPFEASEQSKELVSINIKDRPLEDAVLQISPNLRIYVRADLSNATRSVLRIVVVEREKNP